MLTKEDKRRLAVALADKASAERIIERLTGAEKVAKFGATTNLRTDTAANVAADAESRLDNIEAKINALIDALSA